MFTSTQLIKCIKQGYANALQNKEQPFSANLLRYDLHRKLSASFIRNTHAAIYQQIKNDESDNLICFSNTVKNEAFKRSELLYDLHICEVGESVSGVRKKILPYIRKSWAVVESELHCDNRSSLNDFSKLVASSAPVKLMVLPNSLKNDEMKNYLNGLTPAAKCIEGELFCVFIPHPNKWSSLSSVDDTIKGYEFQNSEWITVSI